MTDLYNQYNQFIRKIVSRYVYDQSYVDDVCQEFWLKTHKYFHTYDPSKPLKKWLSTCAVNTCRRYSPRHSMAHLAFEPMSSDPDPLDSVIQSEDKERLSIALAKIPEKYRECLEAVYLRGVKRRDYAEMGEHSIHSIYGVLQTAKKHLKKAIS